MSKFWLDPAYYGREDATHTLDSGSVMFSNSISCLSYSGCESHKQGNTRNTFNFLYKTIPLPVPLKSHVVFDYILHATQRQHKFLSQLHI